MLSYLLCQAERGGLSVPLILVALKGI
jgi:hypothetical protein